MKQRKQLLNSLGLSSPHLSQHLLRLLLLLVTAIGGAGSSWAEDHTSNFTGLTTSSATIRDTYGSLSGGSWSNSSYSFSDGGTFTVNANSGYVVKSVSITYSASDANRVGGSPTISDNTNYAYSCTGATGTITCNGTAQNTVGITMTNSARIIAVSVTWSDATGGDTPQPSVYDFSMLYPTSGTTPSSVSDLTVTGGSLAVDGEGVSFDSKGIKLGKNADNIKVTLSEKSIIPGTVIEISYQSAYTDGTNTSGVGVFDGAGNNQTINESVASGASGTFTYTFTEASAANYDKEFTITRNNTGKSVYITGITVANAGQKTYKVTFDAGTNGTCATTQLTEESAGEGVVLPKATVNDGYKFIGWSTSSTPTSADAGEAGNTYIPSGNCTLYAYYQELLPATITVTGGGTYNVNDVITLTGSAQPTNGGNIYGVTGVNNGQFYRWKSCNEDGSNLRDISGATKATFTPSSSTAGTYYYRFMCVENVDGTSGFKSTYSEVVKVEVIDPRYAAPTITVNGNWMTVSQPEGQGATMFWKYTRTKAGDISDTNHDAGDGTTEDSKGTFIPYGKYPAGFIQAICVDMTIPTGEGSRTSDITRYGDSEFTVAPAQPTVQMSGENKVKFTMQGQTTSCYFEYKIGESGETKQVFNVTELEIDITSADKIYVWTSASYKHKDNGEEKTDYVGSAPVEFTPTYTDPTVLEITTQPAGASYNYNATAAALSVVATSANELSYQWYSNTEDNTTSGTAIDGATEASYTPSTAAVGTTYYYCVVTEGTTNATLTSATAKIEVIVPKPSVSLHENIVTITSSVADAKYYYTLDKSDPAWEANPARIEYAPDAVAIRENMTKIRAVTYIDGHYSAIQGVDIKTGTSVQYEPVTVLEARGSGVGAGETFTGNTCTTNRNFTNEAKASDGWENTKSPNSLIDVNEKIYRGQTDKNQIIIGLNSTSAKKFVVGFVSNASDTRSFKNLSVDGSVVDCTSNNQTNSSKTDVKRLIITPNSEIEQGSELTFTFSGNVNITYIEVFGTSLEKQCEAPIIAPYQYDATDGWSYHIIPVEGTTLNYTINGDVQTSTSTVTIPANAINVGQIITAWSTKSGWGGSTRTKYTDAATIKPVLKFSPSANATYNKANSTWEAGVAPTFKVYPESLLNSVIYETEETNIGHAENKNGQGEIILGSGQGIAKITASLTVDGIDGLTNGTYTSELTLTLADGFADKLPANYTPKVGETRIVKDNDGNVVLTLNIGGWTHGSNGTSWKNDNNNGSTGSTLTDTWPKTGPYVKGTAIDGYSQQSQAKTDARSETKGSIVWEKEYEKVAPYSLPCRGAYITVTPEKNGQLTIYLVQNGCIDEDVSGEPLCGSPRVYYWFDSEGNCIPSETRLEQKFGYTYDNYETQLESNWKLSTNSDLKQKVEQYWKNKTVDDLEEAIPYQGGYFLIKKAYIKYVVTLLAGKTYYFFSNGSKMGYSGLNFAPTETVNIGLPQGGTENVITVAETLTLNDEVNFNKPGTTTSYNKVTLNRTFEANKWNTICVPFSVSKEQVERVFGKGTVFVGYDGFEGKKLRLVYHAYDYLLPGQPYFIKPTGEGADLTNIVFNNVTITSNVDYVDYDGKNDAFKFIGTFNQLTMLPYDHYINKDGMFAYSSTNSATLKGYRAYLKNNTTGTNQAPATVMSVSFSNFDDDGNEEATSIDGLVEYLKSEGVNVVPAGGVYNLSGQKVANDATDLPAGLYIINGKKVVIK